QLLRRACELVARHQNLAPRRFPTRIWHLDHPRARTLRSCHRPSSAASERLFPMTIIKQNHTLYLTDLRELSAANAQSLRDQACAVVTSDLTTIETDLSETTFVDS